MSFSKKKYINLLKLIKKKYNFISSNLWIRYKNKKNYIILRHDVDFDTSIALQMAKLEKIYKVKSNYFFLLRDVYYDLFSDRTIQDILSIYNLGHNIGLHINPSSYNFFSNPRKRLIRDIKYFEFFYNLKINSISYHQPSIQNFKEISLKNIFNSYNPEVMKYYKYFSDSSMKFDIIKFEECISKNKNVQLLIHPIWWVANGTTKNKKLKYVLKKKINILKKYFNNYTDLLSKINQI